MADIDGLLIVDKPGGITSHDVVDRVRRALRMKRIGHTGTLDPIATGVLVLCLGKATRLQQFIVGSDKEYIARIRLGFSTDTYDRAGEPLEPIRASHTVMEEQIRLLLEDLKGTGEQLPPMFSAKKQAGKRLYKLARRGEEVPRMPVQIRIDALALAPERGEAVCRNEDGTSDFSLLVKCSAGTYIRSLAHEIGQRLECGGHVIELRRTKVGEFGIDRAIALEEFERIAQSGGVGKCVIPLSGIPLDFPTFVLSLAEADRLVRGQPVRRELAVDGAYCRLVDEGGDLIAVGRAVAADGAIHPRVVLR